MKPIISSPVARKFSTTTGRQRRDSKAPVGKRRNAQASAATTGKKSHSDTAPTSRGAGTAPGCVVTPSMA
jgi:hypothetical protein